MYAAWLQLILNIFIVIITAAAAPECQQTAGVSCVGRYRELLSPSRSICIIEEHFL